MLIDRTEEELRMCFDESLAQRIRLALKRKRNITEKKMFGGVGFLVNGNLLVGVWKNSLVVRLGPENEQEALREPHVKNFDITGRAMKGWVFVAADGIKKGEQLAGWIQRALTFVQELPAK